MKSICVALAGLLAFAGGAAAAVPVGAPAPDIVFTNTWNASNGETQLSDFLGSFVLLKFTSL